MLVWITVLFIAIVWLSIYIYKADERDYERDETRRRQKRQALENEYRDFEEMLNIKNACMFYESARYGIKECEED